MKSSSITQYSIAIQFSSLPEELQNIVRANFPSSGISSAVFYGNATGTVGSNSFDLFDDASSPTISTVSGDASILNDYNFLQEPTVVRRLNYDSSTSKIIPDLGFQNGVVYYCAFNCDNVSGMDEDDSQFLGYFHSTTNYLSGVSKDKIQYINKPYYQVRFLSEWSPSQPISAEFISTHSSSVSYISVLSGLNIPNDTKYIEVVG